ncbi:MAG: hypothetical protein OHK0046_42530 [Anaerolineae bacterium]
MSRKLTKSLVIVSVLMLLMTFWSVASAQDGGRAVTVVREYPRPDLGSEPTSGPISALVILSDSPAGDVFFSAANVWSEQTSADAQARALALRAQQAAVSADLSARFGVQTVGNLRFVDNALVVNMDASQLSAVRALPNVLAVIPDKAIPVDMSTSVPFINADDVWEFVGATGEGVRIGIVDSGIDYFHAHFGGSGDAADYAANNPYIVEPGSFPTTKVAGGYDFVGDDWNETFLITPDADPVSCDTPSGSHGTHVAGTAAGIGVTSAGETFTGDYAALTAAELEEFIIGPGVAPDATLYALKIGDCESSVSLVGGLQAWDWAMDPNGDGDPSDRMHVINNSWGSSFGNANEIGEQQMNRLVAAGIVFTGSAGNSSDIFFIAGAPNTADASISTASVLDGGDGFVAVAAEAAALTATYQANTADYGGSIDTLPGEYEIAVADPIDACTPLTNAADVAGKVVLAQRGLCEFSTKSYEGQQAGAIAVIIFNNRPGGAPGLGAGAAAPLVTIPSLGLSRADGLALAANLDATVEFGFTLAGDTISSFTSRGPRGWDGSALVLKPDVAAPGNSITSAFAGTGNGPLTIGGTSMAAPHVAGLAALVREVNPDWTPYQVKAAIMNTAGNDLFTGPNGTGLRYGPQRVGSGRIDANSAVTTDVIAYNSERPDRVSLSFSLVEVVGTASAEQTITLYNDSDTTAAVFSTSVDTIVDTPGVEFTVSPQEVTVPAGGTATVTVSMSATAADMRRDADETADISGFFTGRHYLTEESGNVLFTPVSVEGGGAAVNLPLRVPFYSAVRPAAQVNATIDNLELVPGEGTASIPLAGTGVSNPSGTEAEPLAGLPEEVISLVTPMELGGVDVCGDQFTLFASDDVEDRGKFDLRYLGVTSDYSAFGSVADTWLYFGVSTCGPVDSFATGFYGSVVVPDTLHVYIDSYADGNWDGFADFDVYIDNIGGVVTGSPWEEFNITYCVLDFSLPGAGSCNATLIPPNSVPADFADTSVLMSDAVIIPVPASAIGLTDSASAFQYWATSERVDFDVTPFENGYFIINDFLFAENIYDPANAAFAFNNVQNGGAPLASLIGQPTYIAADGVSLPVEYNTGAGPVNDLLLIHHHNQIGNRAEIVTTTVQPEATDPAPSNLAATLNGLTITSLTSTDTLPVYPTFSWTHRASDSDTAVPGEWYYLYFETTDGEFVGDEWIEASAACVGTTCSINPFTTQGQSGIFGLLDGTALELLGFENGDYNWYVVFYDDETGEVNFEDFGQASFSIDLPAPEEPTGLTVDGLTTTATPIALTDTNLSLRWFADDYATWYQVFVATADFSEVIENDWYPACGGFTCGINLDIYETGEYIFYVQAYGPGGLSIWSTEDEDFAGNAFDLVAPDPVETIERVSPLDGETLSPLTGTGSPIISFEWENPGNAEWFYFELWSVDSAGSYEPYYTTWLPAGPYCNLDTCSIDSTDTNLLEGLLYPVNGTYDWYVFGWNLAGVDLSVDAYIAQGTAVFTVDFPAPGTVRQLTPEAGFTYDNVGLTLNWESDASTAWYGLWVSDPTFEEVAYFDYFPANRYCGLNYGVQLITTTCTFPISLEPGDYVWWIESYGPGGASDWVGLEEPFTVE